ncbi:hypothetical protein [Rickettsiella endosymbiont of Aleochara curtula]|uniref:hypothetical protein n=1 Tax=Rickettsiella endosymbiont of Aleochara curtula TaxID=3077936 RepID=UPI00313CA5E2
MREILWISLPEQVAQEINNVLKFINKRKLPSLSVKQLLLDLIDNKANDWKQVFAHYNNITAVDDINLSELLAKTLSLNNQFLRHEEALEDKLFKPNQLISLIILCYSDPDLVGRKLCKALKDNNSKGIAKEILENSAYVKAQRRIVPAVSNLRLLNYAFYANSPAVQLPDTVRNSVRAGTVREDITLLEVGQFSFINQSFWRPVAAPLKNNASIYFETSPAIESSTYLAVTAEKSSLPTNAGNSNHIDSVLVGSLAFFHLVKNTPVLGVVVGNIHKDIGNTLRYIRNFFLKQNTLRPEQIEQTSRFSSPTTT